VVSFGDIIFKQYILNELLNDNSDITIIVDADWSTGGAGIDYVHTDTPYSKKTYSTPVKLVKMSTRMGKLDIHGEFIGLWKVSGKGSMLVQESLERLSLRPEFKQLMLEDLFNDLANYTTISVRYIHGSWLDVDTIVDLQRSGDF